MVFLTASFNLAVLLALSVVDLKITPVETASTTTISSSAAQISEDRIVNQQTSPSPDIAHEKSQGEGSETVAGQLEKPVQSDSGCFPGFFCLNGYCSGGLKCTCNEGWAGLLCQSKCPSDCVKPEGTCVTGPDNNALCRCTDAFSVYVQGRGCVVTRKEETIVVPTIDQPAQLGTNHLSPFSERECFQGFVCVHGACHFGALRCECDPGWKGQLCDQLCPIDCGPSGRCRETEDYPRSIYCDCLSGYIGRLCESKLFDQHRSVPDRNIRTYTPIPINSYPHSNELGTTVRTSEVDMQESWFAKLIMGTLLSVPIATTALPPSVTEVPVIRSAFNNVGLEVGESQDEGAGIPVKNSTLDAGRDETRSWNDHSEEQVGLGVREGNESTDKNSQGSPEVLADPPTTVSAIDTPTLRPLADRECLPGLVCMHGFCNRAAMFECICDTGWLQPFCDRRCFPPCGPRETCVPEDDGTPTCVCASGNSCSNGSDSLGTTAQSAPVTPSTDETLDIDIWEPLEGYGPLAPLSQRTCPGLGSSLICRYGNCTFEGGIFACDCEPNFSVTGNMPTEVKAAIVVVAVLVLCLLVVVVALYILWRRRNIYILKLVYWFQGFEEDDSRDCDAFVSYASADLDRQFVIQVLVPRLEGRMSFTLCLHQRDFLPGQ
ncbi:interleukin-1 receptor accessory protein-like isoform x5, partial [Plakobranchus ocellatus]